MKRLVASVAICLVAAITAAVAAEDPCASISRMECRTKDKTRDPGIFGDYWWANRFLSRSRLVESLKGKTVDIVMLGDSIMHFWEWKHPKSWEKFTKGRTVLNLGYGGDKTQTVLWRIEHGELDGYTAKCVVLMIGTNNNSANDSDPAKVAAGVKKIVAQVHARQPSATVILHPIFPRGQSASSTAHVAARARNDKTNELLKKFAEGDKGTVWVDFNDKLVDKTGWVPKSLMADEVHPTDAAYDIWMEALKNAPDVKKPKKPSPAEIREKVAAIRDKIDKERCCARYSIWCDHFSRKWTTDKNSEKPLQQAELDAISDRYIELLGEIVALAPGDIRARLDLAEAYLLRHFYDKAEKEYAAVEDALLKQPKPNHFFLGEAMYRLAEIRFAAGDREGTIAKLKDLVSRKLSTVRRGQRDWNYHAVNSLTFLTGATPCELGLPRWTGAKAFPEPQKAEYTEKFAALSDVAVALDGVKAEDVRVKLLIRKLGARGISAAVGGKGTYKVTLALDPKAKVEKKEGYTLDIGEKGAEVRARDLQGVLWGVVSFIQCLKDGEKAVRISKIEDWPDTAWRGYESTPFWRNTTEYTIFSKLNYAVVQRHPLSDGNFSPLSVYECASLAGEFRDFGLKLCYGIANYTMGLGWAYSWKGTLGMRKELCKKFAAMGANIYFPNDDGRYSSENKDDTATGLRPSDYDAEHVLAVFNAVKAEYPWFKMIYCPPYYWGPDSSASYPDDREKYLKSLRIFPEDIDIFWTGGQVKGYNKSKRQVKWFTDLTGQKPAIGQNGTGPHNLLSYIIDETDWNAWHYPGFFENDIKGFLKNSGTPKEGPQLSTLGDCLWNVKGYDKARSVRRAVAQLLGEKMFSILEPGLKGLAANDKYKYGQITADIMQEDIEDLKSRWIVASNCWAKAVEYNPAVKMYGFYDAGVGFAEKVYKSALNPPDFLSKYAKYLGPARELAEKETKFDKSKGDLLYLPTDMTGPLNTYYEHYSLKESRFIKCIRGRDTQFSSTELKFECDPFPPAGDYELVISALDDEVEGSNPMEISVNGKVIYSDNPGFPPFQYAAKKFRIPFDSMQRYNTLKIRNTAPGFNMNGPPYFAISYVLIRKTGEK